ncbi:unnamed protein product, partial [Didymodactylos carnosus]
MTDASKVDHLFHGLKSSFIKEVFRHAPTTSEEVLKVAKQEEVLEQLNYPSSLIFLNTRIHGRNVRAMVDTGATTSIITRSTLNTLPHGQIHGHAGNITLGDGKTTLRRYGWVDLMVKINGMKTHVRAMIVDALAANFILGMDWLTYYDVHILPGDQQLKLHHRRWLTIASFDTDTPIDARVDKEYQILPGSECVITLKITMAPAQNLYFQAINGQLQNQRRITLQDGLVTVDNSTLKVQVLNSSKSSVTLQKNVKLGTLSHLSFDTYCSTMTQVTE